MSSLKRNLGLAAAAVGVGAASLAVVLSQVKSVRRSHARGAARMALVRGSEAAAAGHYGLAEERYREGLAAGADRAVTMNLIGVALRAQGRYEEAVTAYDDSLAAGDERASVHTNRGNALRALGRREEAERCYRLSIEIDPGYPRAYCGLARAAEHRGDFARAARHYREAVERGLAPSRAAPWIYLALARSGDPQPEKALRPGIESQGFERSVAEFLAGTLSPMRLLAKAGSRGEYATRARYYMGMRFLLEGNREAALEQLLKAVRLKRCNSAEYAAAMCEIERLANSD